MRRTGPRWIDVAATAVLVTVVILGTAHVDTAGARRPDALAYLCGVAGVGALVVWRRWAELSTAVAAAALFTYTARNYPAGPALMAGPLALVALGYVAARRAALIGAVAVTIGITLGRWIGEGAVGADELIVVSWAIAALLVGQALRARGERAAAARERQVHRAEQALADERLAIAQDLHDSVAHAMATINVQSGVAAHLIERRPEQARESLEAIRVASRDALDELGAIVRVLRDRDADVPRHPLAGLDRIDVLIERARVDGLDVEHTVSGDVERLPHPVSTAAYRVVQEALTNVRRHAGPGASCQIAIDVSGAGSLSVSITDDGPAPGARPPAATDASSSGLGLLGMRERVESTGGVVTAGPRPERGYRVLAEWPARR